MVLESTLIALQRSMLVKVLQLKKLAASAIPVAWSLNCLYLVQQLTHAAPALSTMTLPQMTGHSSLCKPRTAGIEQYSVKFGMIAGRWCLWNQPNLGRLLCTWETQATSTQEIC